MKTLILKIAAFFTAVAALISGGIANIMDRFEADTPINYKAHVEQLDFYENTLETALPQTVLYDIISAHMSSGGSKEKKAIIIGFDGGRLDGTAYVAENGGFDAMLSGGAKAYISYCGGANYPAPTVQATSTAPGWCSILTGKWGTENGVSDNGISKSNDYLTLLTTLIQSGKADKTAFYTTWGGHFIDENSTYINEKRYCEENGINAAFVKCESQEEIHAKTLEDIARDDCSDFIFPIYEFPDSAGHDTGFSTFNPEYQKAMYDNDIYAGEVIEAIKARKNYENEDWLIILTSDHGGFVTSHGGITIQERMTFIVINKEIEL
ncbi:MAG: alkaline phosphatase family protein [Oscillospiraceae bacterium]|nr:alkaline phosphatase family protein [Oscillospiraceae bacterium]